MTDGLDMPRGKCSDLSQYGGEALPTRTYGLNGDIVHLNAANISLYLVEAAELQSFCDIQVIFPGLAVISF